MLKARIIKPSCSPLAFLVVIPRKKDGKSAFCIDYQALNKRMKGYNFPLPNIEKIVDDMSGVTVFTNLDMFAGYWLIQLA